MYFRYFYRTSTFAENWDLFVCFHWTKKCITILRRFTKSISAFIASLLWFFNSWEINTIHFIGSYEPFYENRTVFATIVSSTKLILEIDLITIRHQRISKQFSQQNNQNKTKLKIQKNEEAKIFVEESISIVRTYFKENVFPILRKFWRPE